MRVVALLVVLLTFTGCGSPNRTDGVSASEAAQLNAAAEKLEAEQANTVR